MLPCHRPRADTSVCAANDKFLTHWTGLLIELKRTKGGVISPVQAEWISTLTAQGYRACVCYGWEAAWDLIVRYLEGRE